MNNNIKKKYIENQPNYVKKLFDTIFNEQNIKNLYKIFVTKTLDDCANMLSYFQISKLLYKGFNNYNHEKISDKIFKINDWIEFLSSLNETEIYKYSYIIKYSNDENIKKACILFLTKVYNELCIILEITDTKIPLLLL